MSKAQLQKIVPHFWYTKEAEEAARFYASVFPNSHVDRVTTLPAAGSTVVVEFTLFGQAFLAISAGPHDPFNDAVSLLVQCETQEEIDKYWNAILDSGGQPQACGWITDKYGVRWQITFAALRDMIADPDRARAERAAKAFLAQVKVDIAKIEAAFEGR
jgi:predicted 3-demethylubiquinone-9 3-methyltransferase (glyoxalase superfamily)